MTPLPMHVAGIIFDMDDTLIDSERAWHAASAELWRDAGSALEGRDFLGGTVEDVARAYLEDFPQAGESEEELCERLETLIRQHLRTSLAPMPGAHELVTRLGATLPLAIGSNSPSAIVRDSVKALGWDSYFTAALGTNDVAHPKPAPDLYQAAARALGAAPGECVIFEDSPVGTRAARSAGAFVVTVGPAARGLGHAAVPSLTDPAITEWNPEARS